MKREIEVPPQAVEVETPTRRLPSVNAQSHWIVQDPETRAFREKFIELIPQKLGGIEMLRRLLEIFPQVDEHGVPRWLVCSGVAVELFARPGRVHHDLDVILFSDRGEAAHVSTAPQLDLLEPNYTGMDVGRTLFCDTALRQYHPELDEDGALIVHPGLLLVQKCCNSFGRVPRPKDIQDAKAIVLAAETDSGELKDFWNVVTRIGLDSLDDAHREIVARRLDEIAQINEQ